MSSIALAYNGIPLLLLAPDFECIIKGTWCTLFTPIEDCRTVFNFFVPLPKKSALCQKIGSQLRGVNSYQPGEI